MNTVDVRYLGNLRNEAIHVRSEKNLVTDAPLDNNGKGEYFSPTDLLCTALVTCMLTIMGITADKKEIPFSGISASLKKIMMPNPRRVGEIIVKITVKHSWDDRQKAIMSRAALACPVAQSLSHELKINLEFSY